MINPFNPLPLGNIPFNRAPELRLKYQHPTSLIKDYPPIFILCQKEAVSPFINDKDFYIDFLNHHADKLYFFGLWKHQSFWVCDVDEMNIPSSLCHQWTHPRHLDLSIEETSISTASFGLAYWHRNHSFCARCGNPLYPILLGEARQCDHKDCRAIFYPRIDPATITLVLHPRDEKVLLIEMHRHKGIYTTLSGFVSFGETIEECVKREVKEETYIDITNITYKASQPWPFPQSLMIGCYAKATSTKIIIEEAELNHANWFSKADIMQLRAKKKLPSKQAISRHLIENWIENF